MQRKHGSTGCSLTWKRRFEQLQLEMRSSTPWMRRHELRRTSECHWDSVEAQIPEELWIDVPPQKKNPKNLRATSTTWLTSWS